MHLNFSKPPEWMDDAACADKPDDHLWFPKTANAPITDEAKRICSLCPVNLACLSYAIETNQEGVWAGTSHQQRKRLAQDGAA